MSEKKVKCTFGGCSKEEDRDKALVPPFKALEDYLKRPVELSDLEANAICVQCARGYVAMTEAEMRRLGKPVGGEALLHRLPDSEKRLREIEARRKAREALRHIRENEWKRRAVANMGAVFAAQFAKIQADVAASEEKAEVIVHPAAAVAETAAKAPRRKRATKKAAAAG